MFQRNTLLDQVFSADQSPLGDVVIDADAHALLEQVADTAITDIELTRQILDGDMLSIVVFDIICDSVQKLGFFCVHGFGGVLCVCPLQIGEDQRGVAKNSGFPVGSALLFFPHTQLE